MNLMKNNLLNYLKMKNTDNKLKSVKLTEEQNEAVNAICKYNNYAIFSEGADNEMTIILNSSADILERGLREIARHPMILELMTNIVIDLHNERK